MLLLMQAMEGQALPTLVEGETLPIKEVELHQVGHTERDVGMLTDVLKRPVQSLCLIFEIFACSMQVNHTKSSVLRPEIASFCCPTWLLLSLQRATLGCRLARQVASSC